MLSNRRLEVLAWTLIYGGLGGMVVGFALRDAAAAIGWSLVGGGAIVAAAGAAAVWQRARRDAAAARSAGIESKGKR